MDSWKSANMEVSSAMERTILKYPIQQKRYEYIKPAGPPFSSPKVKTLIARLACSRASILNHTSTLLPR